MDNQMNRSMLEHYQIANSEHAQEIDKIANLNATRGIENNSLHFIHSFLNPEYLAQLPNGFIVDFIPNGDGEQQAQQLIADAVNADLAFQSGVSGSDEQDRRLTAALLQLVNKPCHIKIGGETQVIVANKDITLSDGGDKADSIGHHSFSAVHSHQVLQNDGINDTHFKMYQHEKTHQVQANPPLPPLTPIRRLARQRKNSIGSSSNDIQIYQGNEINVDEDVDNRPRPLTKKSLPHKKRISKKLKTIDRFEAPQPIRQTVIYQDIQHNPDRDIVGSKLIPRQEQFSCQLCASICTSQLEFFTHLKDHYEPHRITPTISTSTRLSTNSGEVIVLSENNDANDMEFHNFTGTSINSVKMEHEHEAALKENVVHNAQESEVNRDELNMDEVEFSDTEDMLEGIRGVVDKVQESVGNDSSDGNDWYSGSSLNGNIAYKSDENNQNLNTSVENFSMFFKRNLDKGSTNRQIILSGEEGVVHKLSSNASEIVSHDVYEVREVSEKMAAIVTDETMLPADNEIDGMFIKNPDEDGYDDEQDKNGKVLLKLPQRKRKPKPKQKAIDNEYSEGNSRDEFFVSSDDDEKSKKQRRKCTQCDKVFNSSNAYKYHELSHTGERPHQCEVCGKSFFAQSALKVHMRLHSGVKPYECEICKRAFRQWGDWKYHTISIHTNERNFQCEFCGKAFARRYSLVIHRRIHTSERNYKCEFCPKSFRASSYLQNHRKVHTGEKPYSCHICGKKFRVCGDLKRHVNIHSREKKKKGSDAPARASIKTENNKSIGDAKPVNEQIIQYMPKPSASVVDLPSIKTEPNMLMDLSLLHDELNSPSHQSSIKIDPTIQESNASNNGTMIYSDGCIEIFKTEGSDPY